MNPVLPAKIQQICEYADETRKVMSSLNNNLLSLIGEYLQFGLFESDHDNIFFYLRVFTIQTCNFKTCIIDEFLESHIHIAKIAPQLTSIRLHLTPPCIRHKSDILLKVLASRSSPQITAIKIDYFHRSLPKESISILLNMMQHVPVTLCTAINKNTSVTLDSLSTSIRYNPEQLSLHLSSIKNRVDLIPGLSSFPPNFQARYFQIVGIQHSPRPLNFISKFENLTRLECQIGRNYIESSLLTHIPKISLLFHRAPSTPGISILSQENVTQISFSEHFCDDFEVFLDKLSYPNLEKITVYYRKFDDRCLAKLSKFPKLATLILSETKITDAGLLHLKCLTNLSVLETDSTAVTPATNYQLLRYLKAKREKEKTVDN